MAILGHLNKLFSEPPTLERQILLSDVHNDIPSAIVPQTSFFGGTPVNMEAKVVHVHQNTDQQVIIVTQDKTVLTLKKNIALLGKKEWLAPLSTVTSIIMTLLTSNFKNALWLGPPEWRAMFILGGFVATGWLAFTVRKAIRAKSFSAVITDIVHELGGHRRQAAAQTA